MTVCVCVCRTNPESRTQLGFSGTRIHMEKCQTTRRPSLLSWHP
jgi:hypothetical protein